MKKTRVMAACVASVLVLCTGCGLIDQFRKGDALGGTPDDIEGWIRSENDSMISTVWDSEPLHNLVELAGGTSDLMEISVTYTDYAKGREQVFKFNSPGLTVYGIADKRTHEIRQAVIESSVYSINKAIGLFDDTSDVEQTLTLMLAAFAIDNKNVAVVYENLLEVSYDEAEELRKEAGQNDYMPISVYHNDVEYHVGQIDTRDTDNEDSAMFYITTLTDTDDSGIELMEYILSFTEDD